MISECSLLSPHGQGVMPVISKTIRLVSHTIPNIPLVRSIPHRLLKPLHELLGLKGGVIDLLGFRMHLDPRECVDGDLWFTPQFYDHKEFAYLLARFPDNGVLVDAGSNVGFWSLRFAHGFPHGRICAIEANPATFDILCSNIVVNGYTNILPIYVGISDCEGEMPLYCNDTGNRGGDSFSEAASDRDKTVTVAVKPLQMILQEAGIDRIDVLKLDIEGYEKQVLERFFREAPVSLRPKFICTEISHTPEVVDLIQSMGYAMVLTARENCILALQ